MFHPPQAELVTYIKKILGKFRKDEGIYTFSRPTLSIILSKQTISTTKVSSEDIDLSLLGFKMFFIRNTQDTNVYVDFHVKPSVGSELEAYIRTVEVPSNDVVLVLLTDRYPACKLYFYTTSAPTRGYVDCLLASWS